LEAHKPLGIKLTEYFVFFKDNMQFIDSIYLFNSLKLNPVLFFPLNQFHSAATKYVSKYILSLITPCANHKNGSHFCLWNCGASAAPAYQ